MSILPIIKSSTPDPSKLEIERHTEKISHNKITMLYDCIDKLLQNFIHKNFVYHQGSFMTSPKFSLSPNSKLAFTTCHFLTYHRNNIFHFFLFLPPSLNIAINCINSYVKYLDSITDFQFSFIIIWILLDATLKTLKDRYNQNFFS